MKKYLILLMLIRTLDAFAQGFVNLDFENANLSGYGPGLVPASDAIPGWTASLGGVTQANIYYDVAPSALGIYIYDNSDLQGNYSVLIQGTSNEPASIGQTATIPTSTQYLIWWGFLDPDGLTFNGQPLSFSNVGNGPHYDIFEASISAFAGQTAELLFTSRGLPAAGGGSIDNIQFSSSAVPEPPILDWLGLGTLLFVRRSHKGGPHQRHFDRIVRSIS